MKKLFLIIVLMAMAVSSFAQNVYAVGYYSTGSKTKAVLYKNGTRLYTVPNSSYSSKSSRMAFNLEGDVYWMVNYYTSGNELHHSEIWKNDEVLSFPDEIQIKDLYCLNDTLYTVGQHENSNSVKVGVILRGDDFSPYLEIGDGIHTVNIYDADVDKRSGIPYICGYLINDGKYRSAVWKENELYFVGQDFYNDVLPIRASIAEGISIDNGHVYTIGTYSHEYASFDAIWKDNEEIVSIDRYSWISTICAFEGCAYYKYASPHDSKYIVERYPGFQDMLSFNTIDSDVFSIYASLSDIYVCGKMDNKGCIWKNFEVLQQFEDCDVISGIAVDDRGFNLDNEWYYEIQNENGSVTYQHLECQTDTVIENKRPKVIVRSNTQYDKDGHTEVTHEYVYEENGKVYWWNKNLQEFTTLYDFAAVQGEEWEIKVGTESIVMHVDTVGYYEHEGNTYRMLRVSDENGIFSGDIVFGIGHLTSFFPERLMRNVHYTVDGLRCYWVNDELLYHFGDDDCDAIYTELHGVEEMNENGFAVYPNPANSVLYVEVLPMGQKYQITNLMGQTLLQGYITSENQQIDIANLPAGMYFVSVGEHSVKFVVQ